MVEDFENLSYNEKRVLSLLSMFDREVFLNGITMYLNMNRLINDPMLDHHEVRSVLLSLCKLKLAKLVRVDKEDWIFNEYQYCKP